MGNSLVVHWVGLHDATTGSMGSITGQGSKFPLAMWHGQISK